VVAPSRRSPYGSPDESGFPIPQAPDPSTEERGPPRFAADPPRSDIRDETSELAKGLLRELTDAFRERQKFGSGGTRSSSGVAVERIKLLATFFNTVAAGLLTAGLIGPMAAFLFGFSTPQRSNLEIVEGVTIVFMLSVLLHLAARSVLGRLAP
jgi:hypothetical protein